MKLSKRDETTSTTTTTSRTYTLPIIYTPLPSSDTTTTTTTDDPASYGITLFTPLPTDASTTATTTAKLNPEVTYLPPSFAPLSTTKSDSEALLPTETTASTSSSASQTNNDSGLSGGQIAGIVIGSVLGGILALYILYVLCWNRHRRDRRVDHSVDSGGSDMEEKGKQQIYLMDNDFDNELMGDEEENESEYVPYTDDQPVGLPRTQSYYNPDRVYSTTCIPNNPKEDFRSYYKPVSVSSLSSTSSSPSSPQQMQQLQQQQLQQQHKVAPYYGGFQPYYGPYMQPPTAVIHGLGIHTTR